MIPSRLLSLPNCRGMSISKRVPIGFHAVRVVWLQHCQLLFLAPYRSPPSQIIIRMSLMPTSIFRDNLPANALHPPTGSTWCDFSRIWLCRYHNHHRGTNMSYPGSALRIAPIQKR